MPPLEVRQQAGKFAREHKDATIVSAYIAGWSFAQQQPYLNATMVDDSPIYEHTPPISDNDFNVIWNMYDRKDNKQSALKAWQKLSHNEQLRVCAHVPYFVKAHPDKKYRPMLATYLNQKRFNDEEIIDNGNTTTTDTTDRLADYASAIAGYK